MDKITGTPPEFGEQSAINELRDHIRHLAHNYPHHKKIAELLNAPVSVYYRATNEETTAKMLWEIAELAKYNPGQAAALALWSNMVRFMATQDPEKAMTVVAEGMRSTLPPRLLRASIDEGRELLWSVFQKTDYRVTKSHASKIKNYADAHDRHLINSVMRDIARREGLSADDFIGGHGNEPPAPR